MGYGVHAVYTQSMVSGQTSTPSYDLGRSFAQVYLAVPTMTAYCQTATCNIFVQASTNNSTFFRVAFPPSNSSTSGSNDFMIANSVANRMIPVPTGFRYYKIETQNSMTATVGFPLVCSDY